MVGYGWRQPTNLLLLTSLFGRVSDNFWNDVCILFRQWIINRMIFSGFNIFPGFSYSTFQLGTYSNEIGLGKVIMLWFMMHGLIGIVAGV